LGLRVEASEFRVWGLWWVQGSIFKVRGVGCRARGFGFKGVGLRIVNL